VVETDAMVMVAARWALASSSGRILVMRGRAVFALVLLLLASSSARAASDRATEAAAALLEVRDADPLELWRVARRFGDATIVALLDPARPAGVRLAAARTAPYLVEPELALLPLCAMMALRDSDLAPAAARAALQVARGITLLALDHREISPRELAPALAALERVAEQPGLRADIALMARAAAAQLEGAGVPAPPSK
jgi:hypothetical protein